MRTNLPISAIVAGYNEAKLLQSCLNSIKFCDEILYFDLGSSDDSIVVALSFGATVIKHDKVPIVEIIHNKYFQSTKHEWILLIDPDEEIDIKLSNDIYEIFEKGIDQNIGGIIVPWLFYFKNIHLLGTVWGGINKKLLIANNKKMSFTTNVHVGKCLKQGYEYLELEYRLNNAIHHFWMQGYAKLFEKHKRYLSKEGESRYNSGQRTNIIKIIFEFFKQFYFCFKEKNGYKDGFLGFSLSIFWAFYQTISLIELYKFQKKISF